MRINNYQVVTKNLVDIFLTATLWIVARKFTYDIESIWDVGLYDESVYLYNGVSLSLHGLPSAANAPLYAIWYWVLSFWQADRVSLYYLNFTLLAIITPVLLFITLRRYKASQWFSFSVAYMFMLSDGNLPLWPKVSHFALLVIFISFIIASYIQNPIIRLVTLCFGVLLTSYTRPEFFLAYFLVLLYISYLIFIETSTQNKWYYGIVGITSSLVILSLFGLPIGGDGNRSFVAFGQHFSLNWVRWNHSNLSNWTDWLEIMQQNFGKVDSIGQAFQNNPALFFKHLSANFTAIPFNTMTLLFFHNNLFLSPSAPKKIEAIILVILFLFSLLYAGQYKISHLKYQLKSNQEILLVIGCYSFISMISLIVIFPRAHYIVVFSLLLLIAFTILFMPQNEERYSSSFYKYGLPVIISMMLIIFTPSISAQPAVHRYTAETIRFIQSLMIADPVNLLDAEGGYSIYLGSNFRYVPQYTKDRDFLSFLSTHDINMIILSDALKNDSRFREDTTWQYFINNLSEYDYLQENIPGTDRLLIAHRSLTKYVRQ